MEYVYYSVVDQVAALSVCRTHMQDLKDYTQDIHYENFRKKKLLQASPGYVSNAANTPTHTLPLSRAIDTVTRTIQNLEK